MKNRVFLVCLVLVLILVQAMLRSVETNYLTAGPTDMVLGASPEAGMAWSSAALTFALPFAVFTAAALVAVTGMAADCLAWVYEMRGVSEPHDAVYTRLATCAMWCGWPIMAACTAGIFACFPNASAGAKTLSQSGFFITLALCAGLYIVCRLVCHRFRSRTTAAIGIVITLRAARCMIHGSWGWHTNLMEISYILAGLALAYAVRLLLRPSAAARSIGAALVLGAGCGICHIMAQEHLFQTDIPYFGTPCYIYTALMLAVLAGLIWLKWRSLPLDMEEADEN